MGGITHHANGRQQPFSDSTTRRFRGKTVALVDTGVVGTRPVPFGRQNAVTAGGIPRGRGRSTPSGTGILSPTAQHVPAGKVAHPYAHNVPGRRDGAMRCQAEERRMILPGRSVSAGTSSLSMRASRWETATCPISSKGSATVVRAG